MVMAPLSRLITKLLGRRHVAAVTLQSLAESRLSAAELCLVIMVPGHVNGTTSLTRIEEIHAHWGRP